jgi:signal transduction histidine kinase
VSEFVAAGEEERRRIAERIHDDPIQVMAALAMRLQILRRGIADADQQAALEEAERSVQLAIRRLRQVVFDLHPPGLEQEGLAVALALTLEVTQRDASAEYQLDDRLATQPTPARCAILYRVAQEALDNVREHAAAEHVTVTLLERDGGHAVRIEDDGCGFDRGLADEGGEGFASMRARAALGGGSLAIDSREGHGTTVEVWLPAGAGDEPMSRRRPVGAAAGREA